MVGAEDAAEPAGGGGRGAGDAAAVRGARVDDVAERLGTWMDPARVYAVDARHAAVGLGARVWVLAVGLGPRGARPGAVLVGNIDGHPERALPRRREQPSGVSVNSSMHSGVVELRLDDGAAHVKLPAGSSVHAESVEVLVHARFAREPRVLERAPGPIRQVGGAVTRLVPAGGAKGTLRGADDGRGHAR